MSLKSKIEAVIYASEEPVTLQQLVSLLAGEAQAELDDLASGQGALPLGNEAQLTGQDRGTLEAGTQDELAAAVSTGQSAAGESELTAASTVLEAGAGITEQSDVESPQEPSEAVALEPQSSPEATTQASPEDEKRRARDRERAVRDHLRRIVDQLIREYAESDRGIEIREVASGFRMGTKPEYHDAVRGFVKSLKPALKLTLPALETLAVVAYKQPVTAAEISEIRGVDSAGVLGGLMSRKLIATAGRKQVIGRPMLYKTTRDFLLRFGLKDVNELPSMEEFERMAGELVEQEDLPMDNAEAIIEQANARGDAEMIRESNGDSTQDDPASDQTSHIAETDTTGSEPDQTNHTNATAEIAAGGTHEETGEQHTSETSSTEDQQQAEEEHAG